MTYRPVRRSRATARALQISACATSTKMPLADARLKLRNRKCRASSLFVSERRTTSRWRMPKLWGALTSTHRPLCWLKLWLLWGLKCVGPPATSTRHRTRWRRRWQRVDTPFLHGAGRRKRISGGVSTNVWMLKTGSQTWFWTTGEMLLISCLKSILLCLNWLKVSLIFRLVYRILWNGFLFIHHVMLKFKFFFQNPVNSFYNENLPVFEKNSIHSSYYAKIQFLYKKPVNSNKIKNLPDFKNCILFIYLINYNSYFLYLRNCWRKCYRST